MPDKHLIIVYQRLLTLYPRQYRDTYGEQMIRTLADMLQVEQSGRARTRLWLHIGLDLQKSLIEQNIRNLGEKYMNFSKRLFSCTAWVILMIAAIKIFHLLRQIGTDWINLGGGLRVIGLLAYCLLFIGGGLLLAGLSLFGRPKILYQRSIR